MMPKTTVFALLAVTAALAGCANAILSDDRIRSNTALALNQPESAVTISDRHYDGMTNTYYTARTPRGTYSCVINGGTVLSAGIVNPPQCNPK
jgi:hypothetical protein